MSNKRQSIGQAQNNQYETIGNEFVYINPDPPTSGYFLAYDGATNLWSATAGGGGWPLLAPDGASGAPSYSFAGDPTTGFYRDAAGFPAVSDGGTQVTEFNSSGYVNFVDGSSASPSLTWNGDETTGIYHAYSGSTAFTSHGAFCGLFAGAQLTLPYNSSVTVPTLNFAGSSTTGFACSFDQLRIISAGLSVAAFNNADGLTMNGSKNVIVGVGAGSGIVEILNNGTALNPSLTIGSVGPTSGFYAPAANQLSTALGGIQTQLWKASSNTDLVQRNCSNGFQLGTGTVVKQMVTGTFTFSGPLTPGSGFTSTPITLTGFSAVPQILLSVTQGAGASAWDLVVVSVKSATSSSFTIQFQNPTVAGGGATTVGSVTVAWFAIA
jgi:hypothetical protein